ncbi:MAG: class I SAM-dependent methyltransferase [Acidimicrobiia bacterium]
MTDDERGGEAQWSDTLAEAWERHRDRVFEAQRHVSEWLIDQVDPQPGQTILELAAGPGETGFLAATRVGPQGRLISTDVGPGMVEAARRGVAARGLGNVECRLMDAQEIDLPDSSVDGVLCRFGLMLMPDPARAVEGARRILRPGGRLAYAVWGTPDRNPWIALMAGALREHGHQPPGDPFAPGGLFSLASSARNREVLDGAGCAGVKIEELEGDMRFTDFEDYWSFQSQLAGGIALMISSLTAGAIDAVRATLEPRLAPFRQAGGYVIPSMAVAACGGSP